MESELSLRGPKGLGFRVRGPDPLIVPTFGPYSPKVEGLGFTGLRVQGP